MEKTRPRVAAIYLPRFIIQRRLREDASLAHRPVGIIKSQEKTDIVLAASRSALVAGITPGITATQAKALCPGLRLLPDDPVGDMRALEGLAESLLAGSPAVELCGPEGIFADTSTSSFFGGENELLRVLADRCRTLGYHANLVIADNKFTAMALAVHRPRPARVSGSMASALAPLPLSALPASEDLRWAFEAMGLKTLGELAVLPASGVAARFGRPGVLMQRLAQGEDLNPLIPFRPSPPLLEHLALEWPSESLEPVLFALKTVLDRLNARLSGQGLALSKLEVQLKLDAIKAPVRVSLPLVRATNSSRLLLSLFRERLSDFKISAPVVGLSVEALETGAAEGVQLCVGDKPEVDEALESTLARLRAGLGDGAIFSARPTDRHRPEVAWDTAPFRPGQVELIQKKEKPKPRRAYLARLLVQDPTNGSIEPASGGRVPILEDPLMRPGARPARLLSEPKPLQVEMSPSGRIVAVRIGSRRHAAASVCGPERLRGEWWRTGFSRDYYRALVTGLGGCWIYRDIKDGAFYLHGYFD